MILSGPEGFWGSLERRVTHSLVAWSDEAVAEYKRAFFTADGVHGVSSSSEICGIRDKRTSCGCIVDPLYSACD
jgi:hypothetical protein